MYIVLGIFVLGQLTVHKQPGVKWLNFLGRNITSVMLTRLQRQRQRQTKMTMAMAYTVQYCKIQKKNEIYSCVHRQYSNCF